MLKPEFIKKLKQSNISKNPKLTMERLRAAWRPLAKAKRLEVLKMADLQKTSIERAYKFGNVSAKIIVSLAQVIQVDPLYLLGENDEARPYSDDLIIKFLKGLGYNVSKADTVKSKKAEPQPEEKKAEPVQPVVTPPVETPPVVIASEECDCPAEKPTEKPAEKPAESTSLSCQLNTFFDANAKGKLDDLKEDALITLLKGLFIQAEFDAVKKDRLAAIKGLLLM